MRRVSKYRIFPLSEKAEIAEAPSFQHVNTLARLYADSTFAVTKKTVWEMILPGIENDVSSMTFRRRC